MTTPGEIHGARIGERQIGIRATEQFTYEKRAAAIPPLVKPVYCWGAYHVRTRLQS